VSKSAFAPISSVTGYSNGQETLFIHTEASDPKIAKILTDMMGGSPVLVVPASVRNDNTAPGRSPQGCG